MMIFAELYMSACIPMGMPIRSIFVRESPQIAIRRTDSLYMSSVRSSAISTNSALIACENTVAAATPNTPRSKTITSSRSKTVFSAQQTIKSYNGFLVSPTARKIAAPTL